MTNIEKFRGTGDVDREDGPDYTPVPGQWYWLSLETADPRYEPDGDSPDIYVEREGCVLGCCERVGSNFALLVFPNAGKYRGQPRVRVHYSDYSKLVHEPEATTILGGFTQIRQQRVQRLLAEVHRVTALLAVAPAAHLPDGGATQALARVTDVRSMPEYKEALVKAKTETLPGLFKEIEEQNRQVAEMMKAQVIPLQVQAALVQPAISRIEDRIFTVELYAGLCEYTVCVRDGAPPPPATPISLHQRRHYMDEECLAAYEAGGMDYQSIEDFDKWLALPANADRILPHPRSVVAFRVRRYEKERENPITYGEMIRLWREKEADRQTFLYFRNGEQIHRLTTGIDFGEQLFPDADRQTIAGQSYMYLPHLAVEGIINANQYETMVAEHAAREARNKVLEAEYETEKAVWERLCAAAEAKGFSAPKRRRAPAGFWDERDPEKMAAIAAHNAEVERNEAGWPSDEFEPEYPKYERAPTDRDPDNYRPYTPEDVYYDDACEFVHKQIAEHNRLVTVLQGVLDRSQVLHPHPPWQLWDAEQFAVAIAPVYDLSRALVPAVRPDFEAYRRKCSLHIRPGAVFVGQRLAWMEREAEKENERRRRPHARGDYYRTLTVYEPRGNPGPAVVASATRIAKGQASFSWTKSSGARDAISVDTTRLLCVSGYKKGDFKQFFADPRTRAEYLEWAPYLLAAEDFVCGKVRPQREEEE